MGQPRLDAEVLQRLEQLSSDLLLTSGITPEQLRHADANQLLSLQTQLMMGDQWAAIDIPKELISRSATIDSRRQYRLALAIPPEVAPESESAKRVWCELLRVAIALRLWPGHKGRRQAYSSILLMVRSVGLVTRHIVGLEGTGFWSRISREQFRSLSGQRGPTYCGVICRLHRLGAIGDAPTGRARPSGAQGARDRTGEAEFTSQVDSEVQWQPFPDAFTVQAGWNAIHMMQWIGPTLLDALEASEQVQPRTSATRKPVRGRRLSGSRLSVVRAATKDPVIAQWQWTGPDGAALTRLPMQAFFRARPIGAFDWPPRSHHQAKSILTALQASHLWLVSLAMAGRHGEILSLEEGCLRREQSDTPTGVMHTWKLDGVGGRPHEAPVPALVVAALLQQERLSRFIKRAYAIEGKHLWVMTGRRYGEPLTDLGWALQVLVSTFGLDPLLEGTRAHMHRIRKTLVRIVALALVHAPKILMDVLGHRDEQMTIMRYILSDPGLLAEIQETVRELIVLKGIEAVQKRDQLQGKAAPVLRERVAEYARRVGTKAMEPQHLMEFVRAMTEDGGGWAIIAPGVVCTGFTRGGMCNKGQGGADPHYCNPQCDNQLVMPEFDEDGVKVVSAVTRAIETLDYILDKLHKAEENGEDMLIAQFAGQVKALLGRWREVDQHLAGHAMQKRHFSDVVLLQ